MNNFPKFTEIIVSTTSLASELVANILFEIGAEGVTILDKQDILNIYSQVKTWDYIDSSVQAMPDDIVYVKSGFATDSIEDTIYRLQEGLDELKSNSTFLLGSLDIDTKPIEDEDYNFVWRKYYKPIHAGNIVIVPAWIEYIPSKHEKIILIEPGMAFGTGEHETTKLVLTQLSGIDLVDKTVLDVGTGSGILGIGAIKCGAKFSHMFDIDEDAIITAHKNVVLNQVEDVVDLRCADLAIENIGKMDVILANITADVLVRLSEIILRYTGANTVLVLSGILERYLDMVVDCYEKIGYKVVQILKDKEWCSVKLEVSSGN